MQPIGSSITKNNNSFASGSDSFAKSSYYQDTKTSFKPLHGNAKYHDEHKTSLNVSMERALTKSNDFNANGRHSSSFNAPPSKALSLWDQPQSPTASIKTTCNSSSSKESLWASAQSSPNSVQREQLKQQLFANSSSLWENPSSKLSQASLMSKNDSSNSIWYTPPRMQSPPTNTTINGWDNAPMGQKKDEYATDAHALIRPQDLSPTDHWHNSSNGSSGNVIKMDAFDSKWSNTAMTKSFNRINSNVFTSTPIKPAVNKMANESSNANCFAPNEVNSFYNSMAPSNSGGGVGGIGAASTATPASSSCLQLFSDEFINYLNMIN